MRLLYVLIAYLLAPVVCGVMLWRGLRDRSHWDNFGERFGFGPGPAVGGSIWVHAVSVGEVQAAATLVRALRERYPAVPLVVTTVTPTGAQRARELFRDGVLVRYVPYDLPGSVRRFFDRVRPRVAIILETELWPTLYHECGRRRVPLVLASARSSPRSRRRSWCAPPASTRCSCWCRATRTASPRSQTSCSGAASRSCAAAPTRDGRAAHRR